MSQLCTSLGIPTIAGAKKDHAPAEPVVVDQVNDFLR